MARIKMMPLLPALRKAARRASLILAGNPETGLLLKRSGAREVVPFLDTGVREDFLADPRPEERPAGKKLTILWVGQLIPRKGFLLAVQALARVRNLPFRLLVAGRGPLQKQMEDLVAQLGLSDRVKFLGFVPFPLMSELYRSADVFLFTSLRDSSGSQILEAMASGLPVITLNHQGAGAFVPEEAAIKVPVTHPQQTIFEIARGIERLAVRTEDRMQMGRAAVEFERSQTWPCRVQAVSALYRDALEDIRKPSLQLANA